MNVIAKRTLREFWSKHADSKSALEEWHSMASKAIWQKPDDVTSSVSNSRYLGNDRFYFKIKGDKYRLLVKIVFQAKQVYVRFIGTHADYDKLEDATKV